MTGHPIIRRLLAGVLLVLFALSVTPKVFVHALVAHHQDSHLSIGHDKTDQLNKAGFHCDVENAVVELPYLSYALSIQLEVPQSFREHQAGPAHPCYCSDHFIFGLRGPPAAI